MDLDPDAVAEAVAEVLAVTGLLDDGSGERVDGTAAAPGADGLEARASWAERTSA